jgi:hypothetical protein
MGNKNFLLIVLLLQQDASRRGHGTVWISSGLLPKPLSRPPSHVVSQEIQSQPPMADKRRVHGKPIEVDLSPHVGILELGLSVDVLSRILIDKCTKVWTMRKRHVRPSF